MSTFLKSCYVITSFFIRMCSIPNSFNSRMYIVLHEAPSYMPSFFLIIIIFSI